MESSKPVVKPPPTDFSEFHQQEVMRRLREEQENETEWDRRMKEQDRLEQEKQRVEEEERNKAMEEAMSEYWENLSDSDEERQLEDDGTDVEDTKGICRAHIAKRLEILRDGKEEDLSEAEFEELPMFDRMRIDYIEEHEFDAEQTDREVKKFIRYRIEHSPFNDVVIGYKTLLEMYDSLLGPDFYYLSLFKSAAELVEHERWSLFGY